LQKDLQQEKIGINVPKSEVKEALECAEVFCFAYRNETTAGR
jgi:hypothetical protein